MPRRGRTGGAPAPPPVRSTNAARSRSVQEIDCSSIIRSRSPRSARRSAERPADADGHACQRACRHQRLERAPVGVVGVGDHVGEPLGELGVESAAREVDQHRRPPARRLGHLEDADDPPFLEPDDLADEARRPPSPTARARDRVAGSRAPCAPPCPNGCAPPRRRGRARRRSRRRSRGCRTRWRAAPPSTADR